MGINLQNGFATNLTSSVNAGDTTSPLNSIPTVDAPFYLAFDATNINGNYEVVKVTSKTATNVLHAALTNSHTTDEEVRMVMPAEAFNSSITTDTFSATPTWDLATSLHQMTLTASITAMTISNATIGQSFIIRLTQGGSGSYTAAWFTTIKWEGGATPTLTTTVGKTDVFGFLVTGAGTYDGFVIGQNL